MKFMLVVTVVLDAKDHGAADAARARILAAARADPAVMAASAPFPVAGR